jgi:integrase
VEWLTCHIEASASCHSVTASALSRFGRFDRADMFAARFCHCAGDKLANDGHDTRALQHYLGHKNIQHTVRYTELSPDRFKDFWR